MNVDGIGDVLLRPIRPEDEALYAEFMAHVAPEDHRLRFFSAKQSLSHRLLARLTQIDYARDMAFVALGTIIGSAARCRPILRRSGPVARRVRHPGPHRLEGAWAGLDADATPDRPCKGHRGGRALRLSVGRECRHAAHMPRARFCRHLVRRRSNPLRCGAATRAADAGIILGATLDGQLGHGRFEERRRRSLGRHPCPGDAPVSIISWRSTTSTVASDASSRRLATRSRKTTGGASSQSPGTVR